MLPWFRPRPRSRWGDPPRKGPRLNCEELESRTLPTVSAPTPPLFPPDTSPTSLPLSLPDGQGAFMVVADLGKDGEEDFIFLDRDLARLVARYGRGDPFVIADEADGLVDPRAIRLGDLDGDGLPDLVVANGAGNNLLIFPGLPGGSFGPELMGGRGIPVGLGPVDLAFYPDDRQTDGLFLPPRLVVVDQDSDDVVILFGQASTLEIRERFEAGIRPTSVLVADATGDGILDIVITEGGSDQVRILPGLGLGKFDDSFPRLLSTGSLPVQCLIEDFTGDGTVDLVTVNRGSDSLTFFESVPNPTTVGRELPSGGQAPSAALAQDVNSDGISDLVVANSGNNSVALFLGTPSGPVLAETQTSPGFQPMALAGLASPLASEVYAGDSSLALASLLTFAASPLNSNQSSSDSPPLPIPSRPDDDVSTGTGDLGDSAPIAALLPLVPGMVALVPTLVAGAPLLDQSPVYRLSLDSDEPGPFLHESIFTLVLTDSPLPDEDREDSPGPGGEGGSDVERFVLGIEEAVRDSPRVPANRQVVRLVLPGSTVLEEESSADPHPGLSTGVCPLATSPEASYSTGKSTQGETVLSCWIAGLAGPLLDSLMQRRSAGMVMPSGGCEGEGGRGAQAILDALFALRHEPAAPPAPESAPNHLGLAGLAAGAIGAIGVAGLMLYAAGRGRRPVWRGPLTAVTRGHPPGTLFHP
jgi:FG-GAP-like repeat/FG-GAP repeat